MTKVVAIRCQILSLKCTKIYFGWGFAMNHAAGELTTYSPLEGIKGAYF